MLKNDLLKNDGEIIRIITILIYDGQSVQMQMNCDAAR